MLRLALSVMIAAVCVSVGQAVGPLRDAPRPVSLTEWAKTQKGRHAYGMYFKHKGQWAKVGWVVEETRIGKHEGTPVLEVVSESYVRTAFDGQPSLKTEKTRTAFELNGDGRILYAESTRTEDGNTMVRKAMRTTTGLKITTRNEDTMRTTERDVAMVKDNLKRRRQLDTWLAGARKPGDKHTHYGLSWDEDDGNQVEEYNFKSRKKLQISGIETDVLLIQIVEHDGKLDAEVLPDGKLLKAVMGNFVMLQLEKEADVKKMTGKVVDLMESASVFVDKDLGRGRDVVALTLEVSGVSDDFKLPGSHRQKYTPGQGKEPGTLQLKTDFRIDKAQPLSKDDKKKYLAATPRIQSDAQAIRKQAAQIVGDEDNPLSKIRLLQSWVYGKVRKTYSANSDTSLEVLDAMAGDCTEHSLLFTALARAAGLPAREVGGLAFVSGKRPLFGWHAWAEVHDGHQWVSVDPTWDEVYVDATHIKMSEGDKDLAWVNIAGTIRLKVVDFKTRKR